MNPDRDPHPTRDPISTRLLELLYTARKARGWTVRDLAHAADVSPSYISLIENGHKVPDAPIIERIGRALELDPKLLRAWVTVRGRSADARTGVEAAHQLMAALQELEPSPNAALPSALHSPAAAYGPPPELPDPGRYVIGIPLADEGTEPSEADLRSTGRRLWMDRRAVPERDALRGAFAWRLSSEGLRRVRGLYRRGDMVVIARDAWTPRADGINPRQVYAVRHDGGIVLSRIGWTGGRLVLLAGEGDGGGLELLDARTERELRKLVVGRVIASVQRFR